MEVQLKSVHEHMLGLGLGALAHANWHANYSSSENDYWPELSVLQAAHAAEILIKARIAQEHPLLIFDQLPRSTQVGGPFLELRHLSEYGRAAQYLDLPERLWAATGLRLSNIDRYREFGILRNAIQHFTSPEGRDLSQDTIEFIYAVIDPFIHKCWGFYAVDYNEDYEPHVYLMANLIRRGVLFLVSPEARSALAHTDLEWHERNPEYRAEMEKRFTETAQASES